jgi:hypothetical protein
VINRADHLILGARACSKFDLAEVALEFVQLSGGEFGNRVATKPRIPVLREVAHLGRYLGTALAAAKG